MKNRNVFMISLIIMIITIICMGINKFISPLPDIVIIVAAVIMIINLVVLSYSIVKLKSNNK